MVYNKATAVKKFIDSQFALDGNNISILGPSRSIITKIKNKYRWRIVIKYKDMEKLIDVLTGVLDKFYQKQDKNGISISVDINPVNML